MVEKYLISLDDLVKFYPMSDIPQSRLDPYIIKAQELDLKPILNDVLYYDFISKFDDTGDAMYSEYQDLLNGTTYTYSGQTIEYPGLKPMLCSFVMARFLPMQQTNINRYSITVKTNQVSEPVQASQLTYMANNMRADALAYQLQVEQYLQQNPSTYPLYQVAPQNVQGRTGVRFMNSAGSKRGTFGWWNGNFY